MATETAATIPAMPDILTANTYFWRPGGTARQRRANEERHIRRVEAWLNHPAVAERLVAAGIEIEFSYSESCNHVYKRVKVWRNGKRSNLSAVKRALGIE